MADIAISVIVPVYKVERYLRVCLDSICNQSFRDIEIILIDDCSPDNSKEIIEEYQARDARIVLVSLDKNGGLGNARNVGIRHAQADLIYYVDSDDFIRLDTLSVLYHKMKTYPEDIDVVVGGFVHIKDADYTMDMNKRISPHPIKGYHFSYKKDKIVSTPHILPLFGKSDDSYSIAPSAWGKLYKKSLFIDNNLTYPKIFHEDLATTPLVLLHAKNVLFIKEVQYYYRERESSIMQNDDFDHKQTLIEHKVFCIDIVRNYFVENNVFSQYEETLKAMFFTQLLSSLFNKKTLPKERALFIHMGCDLMLKEMEHTHGLFDIDSFYQFMRWYTSYFSPGEFYSVQFYMWFASLSFSKKILAILSRVVRFPWIIARRIVSK